MQNSIVGLVREFSRRARVEGILVQKRNLEETWGLLSGPADPFFESTSLFGGLQILPVELEGEREKIMTFLEGQLADLGVDEGDLPSLDNDLL